MTRRIIEIFAGVILTFCLIANYSGKEEEAQLLIWYALTPNVLKIVTWLVLFFIAGRLIFGRYRDYSKYFYSLLVKLFGDPKKANK